MSLERRPVDLQLTSDAPTKKPIAASGWYECVDGTVVRFVWREGKPVKTAKVASWAEVHRLEHDERAPS